MIEQKLTKLATFSGQIVDSHRPSHILIITLITQCCLPVAQASSSFKTHIHVYTHIYHTTLITNMLYLVAYVQLF